MPDVLTVLNTYNYVFSANQITITPPLTFCVSLLHALYNPEPLELHKVVRCLHCPSDLFDWVPDVKLAEHQKLLWNTQGPHI